MDIGGEYMVPASREVVWELLNDPEVLAQCIPGCEELSASAEDEFTAKVVLRIGPVKATFSGVVKLTDKVHPESFRMSGEGQGGIAGFAKGGANVNLEDVDGETKLTYDVDVQIGGKMAQLGSRLIQSTSKKLAGKFFATFCEVAEARISA